MENSSYAMRPGITTSFVTYIVEPREEIKAWKKASFVSTPTPSNAKKCHT